jgi:2-keto-3-deoxy-L-rhamnonate aldolase RhmA
VEVREDVVLTLWTSEPGLARRADAAGIDRIGIDLDHLGKAERQRGLATWVSPHCEADLPSVRQALSHAALFARTDPPNDGLEPQVRRLLDGGVDVVMLPMFERPDEVARFVEWVDGEATVVLLLETLEAIEHLDEIVGLEGVDEVHVGLNDLTLALGLRNRFALLCSPVMERISAAVRGAGLRFGFGGIGRAGEADLPIPADLIYAQYARLGGRAALISRAFLAADADAVDLRREIGRARARLEWWNHRPKREIDEATDSLTERVRAVAAW